MYIEWISYTKAMFGDVVNYRCVVCVAHLNVCVIERKRVYSENVVGSTKDLSILEIKITVYI